MKMRKVLVILLALLVLAGGAMIVMNFRNSQDIVAIQKTHDAVLKDYQTLLNNAANSTVSITENGEKLGSYTLEELGILSDTQESITGRFSVDDRTKPEIFRAKGYEEKLAWSALAHPSGLHIPVSMLAYSDEPVSAMLDGLTRTPAKDAYPIYNGHGYSVVSEEKGNELDKDMILAAFRPVVESIVISLDAPSEANLEISELDCYLKPKVTAANQSFDFQSMLEDSVNQLLYTIDLNLDGQSLPDKIRNIKGSDLLPYISLDRKNNIQVDRAGLKALTAGWAAGANVSNTDFILNTYVDGPKPMPFIQVNYTLNTDSIAKKLADNLQALNSAAIDADYTCTDSEGKPFSLGSVYIEVDIDNQRLTLYRDGQVVVSTDIVTGNLNGHQTITGLYYAYNKETDVTMVGDDYRVFSNYWVGIEGLYGIHDASWRKHFGWDFYVNGGSHGCVNVPVEAMPTIFENSEVGTPIIIFGKNQWYKPDPEVTRILQEPGL